MCYDQPPFLVIYLPDENIISDSEENTNLVSGFWVESLEWAFAAKFAAGAQEVNKEPAAYIITSSHLRYQEITGWPTTTDDELINCQAYPTTLLSDPMPTHLVYNISASEVLGGRDSSLRNEDQFSGLRN